MKSLIKYAAIAVIMALPFVARADAEAEAAAAPHDHEAPTQPVRVHVHEPVVEPAEKVWEGSVGYDLSSQYIFRGVDITGNNWLSSPSASVSAYGFTAGYWAGYGHDDLTGSDSDYQENNFTLTYTTDIADDQLAVTGGYIFYQFPDGDLHDTHELWASLAANMFLSPTATWYWDFDEVGGSYLTLGVSHSFDMNEVFGLDDSVAWTVDPSASLGIDFDYNSNGTDLNDILFGISTSVQLTDQLEIHGSINASIALSGLNDIGQGNEAWAVVGASVSF